jgi:hypothetical protein
MKQSHADKIDIFICVMSCLVMLGGVGVIADTIGILSALLNVF